MIIHRLSIYTSKKHSPLNPNILSTCTSLFRHPAKPKPSLLGASSVVNNF